MERQEFISKLGIGLVAVCAGCSLVSCGSKGSNPSPDVGGAPPPPRTGSGNVFTIDTSSELVNIGDSKMEDGIILVRIAAGSAESSFTAVQVACTHQGTAINYNTGQAIFICPAHGSEFSKNGQVLQGPASTPLQKYNVTISGTTLTVSA
jgi:cytochrome b6-f complex iron-sulfur subunit